MRFWGFVAGFIIGGCAPVGDDTLFFAIACGYIGYLLARIATPDIPKVNKEEK